MRHASRLTGSETGAWTTAMFVEAAYKDLSKAR